MLDPSRFDFCTEFAFVEQSVEFYVNLKGLGDTRFRLDVLHAPDSGTPYTVSAYIEHEISAPTEVEPHATKRVRAVYDLPSNLALSRSADLALADALSWLRERCAARANLTSNFPATPPRRAVAGVIDEGDVTDVDEAQQRTRRRKPPETLWAIS